MFNCKRYIAVLIVLQVVLGLAYINSVPRIFFDEVWDTALGYNLAINGSLSHPFVEGLGGVDIHFVQPRVVMPLVCAAIFKVADYSIFTGRIASLILSILAAVSLYAVMHRWFSEKQAFWICLAMIIHPWFFEVSRRSRPEIYYTALALAFLWLLMVFFDSGSRRAAFFTGVLAGLSALTHPNGLIIVFSISVSVVLWCRTRPIGRLILWASAGLVLVILPYVIYVIWATQDPRVSFADQMQTLSLHKSLLHSEIVRWKSFLQWPKGAPLAVVMLASWIVAWYRSSNADKTVATIIALFALVLPFVNVNPTARYLAAIVPFFSALIIRLIWRLLAGGGVVWQNWYKTRFAISASIAVIYSSICISAIGLLFYCFRGADVNKVINHVASVVEPGSHVYGDPIFWFGHDRYQYGPWLYVPEEEPITVREAIGWAFKYRFDYVVRTTWSLVTPKGVDSPPNSMPDFRNDCLGDHLCRIFGTKIDEFHDPYYGPIEIYKLNWDKRF